MDCRGLLCGMGNTGSMTSADELNEQYDADGSVTQVPERNDEVHAGESAVAQSRESAVTIPAGTVVLAATPIGNVGDASARLVALLERPISWPPKTRAASTISPVASASM